METMKCYICLKIKPIDQFYWMNKVKGIKQHNCKVCMDEARRRYVNKNREKIRAGQVRRNLVLRQRQRRFVFDYLKKHPCSICGIADPLVLQFDHVDPKNKVSPVSKFASQTSSLKKLKLELKKCQTLCGNCHRRKTILQFDQYIK